MSLSPRHRAEIEATLGKPAEIIDRSVQLGTAAVTPLTSDIAAAITSAADFDAAIKAAESAIDGHADSATLAAMVTMPALITDLLGRLMVREETYGTRAEASREPVSEIVTLAESEPRFSDLPWEEAIKAFRERGQMSPRELETLIAGYQERGAEARALMLETVRASVRDSIERAMREGMTFADFQKDVNATVIEPLGLSPAQPWYLDTVMRTNVLSAYGEGRTQAQTDPAVANEFPFWRKLVVGDGRTRSEHAALVGHVFRHGNPKTDRLRGTLGFNCRCADQAVAASYSGPITEDVPDGFSFDAGWVS